MTGRHRKVKRSNSTAATMKVAITGAVLSGSGGLLAGHAGAATDSQWDLVSRCESGGNWATNTGNGYQGGLQFSPATWSAYGGAQYAAEAHRASKEQQIAIAERVLAGQGRGAWPVCGGPLTAATPRNILEELPVAVPATPTSAERNAVAAQSLDAETSAEPQLVDAAEAAAPVEAADETPTPPDDQSALSEPLPAPEPPARDAGPSDAAPAPDALAGEPQDAVLLPPVTDVGASEPGTEALLVQAAATVPESDAPNEVMLMALVHRYSGTPYIWGGDSAKGTDCSGLASWLANAATGRPIFGDRFSTHTEESALLARGFRYGTVPGALVIGWNDHHTAVTLADGTPVASGEGGGIRIGGGGAYQAQFDRHMYLSITPGRRESQAASSDAPAALDSADT